MPSSAADNLDINALVSEVPGFQRRLHDIKAGISNVPFYPYDTLANLGQLDRLLTGDNRRLLKLAAGKPIADIGAADGDLAFFLEQQGSDVHIVDNAPTNHNQLKGARAVKLALDSKVEIHDVDLDSQFHLPEKDYGLVLFLGILYHLKNPFYALEQLAKSSRHIVLSTRIAQYVAPAPQGLLADLINRVGQYLPLVNRGDVSIEHSSLAYLVDDYECNNDPTNFWIFSATGLKRILKRSGWDILDFTTVGDQVHSDPIGQKTDQRAFVLARSRVLV
jgi:tRNA (mo5U34)-methyltransferase